MTGSLAQARSSTWRPAAARAHSGGVRRYPISPARQVQLSPAQVVPPPLSRLALRRRGKMAAEKQVPGGGGGGGSGGGSGGGGSGGGRGAGGEENKENERPSAGSKANKEFGDSLSLEILQIIKESQQQHGLRHGDFQRYRGYCSRRQRRLRKTLNFKMGNRHKFTGKKVTEELLTDNRYLLLVLMDAERAWSYAMQLKQEANTEPRKRFHLLSRLRKAVKHAEELERLCESNRVDAKTKLEAQAYTAYLSGMLRFEHQEWKAAIEAFNKCKTIYEKLASAFTEEQAVLYNQRVEEISPNIRYCAYNIGDQSAINELMQMRLRSGGTEGLLAEKLEALITQTRAKQAATMSEVEWRGRTVPVKIDKVRIFLLGLADNEAAIVQAESEETKERLFESMLSECRDAIQVVREELKPDQKQRDYILEGEPGKVSNLQYLHSYLTYIKLSTAIKRNENMAKGLQRALLQQQPEDDSKRSPRPQDLIRLYDIILQNLVELLQLPGLEEDKAFQKEIGLKTLVFKAYRCFFIAQSYVLVKKWSEALVLYDRVLKYANEVNSDAGAFKNSLKDLPDVQELITQVRSEKCSLQAAAILDANDAHQTETSSSQVKDNKPLVERFETFCLDPSLVTKQANLVHFPPGFRPVPCKPLFFDLALNHVAFPPLEDKLEQKTKSGLTGYIKGIFGFRS
ncbi:signal recognition particle subunit SRP68 [Pongo pygmaeus]|uniref:signal recognition particle subunit SRP68 n=1 Tax=Pongo pygmaeus TaxID=9600 RepID=UPI003005670F